MALILSLETSATRCSVALHENGALVKTQEILEGQSHASKLAILIRNLFEDGNVSIGNINAVAISSGPGSYTGLRIGTSTAKGICYALKVPLISVHTLDLLGFEFVQNWPEKRGLLCPMIDAKRMEVYCQVMNSDLEVVKPVESMIIGPDAFAELLSDKELFLFGDGSEKSRTVITHKNAFFVDGIVPKAASMGQPAFSKFRRSDFEDLVNFTPFYLKEFIAKKAQSVFFDFEK
jgi:tRNA threonylcarbamoyladenosine biosynthesis protein TsaB